MTFDPASLGSILGVWAHPDDETYLSGALMAMARDAGQRVVCVTATRGEAGSQDEARWPPATLGEVRTRELDEALAILGVQEHHWLDYPDGGCETIPDEEAIARIAALIAEVAPDTVLTFGPEGQTMHPDHIAVHRWATAAFDRAAPRGARLMYSTVTPEWHAAYVDRLNEFNVFGPGSPSVTPEAELTIYFPIEGEVMDRKLAALNAQVSQTEGLLGALGRELVVAIASVEPYRLAKVRD